MGLTYRMVQADSGRHRRVDERRVPGARRLGRGRHRRVRQVRLRGERRGGHRPRPGRRPADGGRQSSRRRRCTRRGTGPSRTSRSSSRRPKRCSSRSSTSAGDEGRHGRRSRRSRGEPVRLARAVGVDEVFLAAEADVEKETGAKVGFAGPVGFPGRIVVDRAAARSSGRRHGRQRDRLPPHERVFGRDYRRDRRPAPRRDGRPVPQLRRGTLSRTGGSRRATSSSSARSTRPR
jgi:hypothetical protein